MAKHVVLVGAGHAHLLTISECAEYIEAGHRITVVSAGRYHYYSGMGPGLLSGIYRPQEVRFHVARLARSRGATFIEDEVISINPETRLLGLRSGREVAYDVVSFNTGSQVAAGSLAGSPDHIFTVKPVENLYQAHCRISEALKQGTVRVVVIGGGAAGVEIAGNARQIGTAGKGRVEVTLVSRGEILSGFIPRVRSRVRHKMAASGIEVVENMSVKSFQNRVCRLEDNREIPFDFAFVATGIRPHSLFADSRLPTAADRGLLVNEYLQSVQYPEIFGGGDCIHFRPRALKRVGVYAVRQSPILFHNLLAFAAGRSLSIFKPQQDYLLILNMGDGTGLLNKKFLVLDGRLAFKIKDHIDRKFVKYFQLSGELTEGGDG
jgi:NADH dehydrogenase FAD-containing subunit